MTELLEFDRRTESAILRIPDRLSIREDVRAEWADTFARVLGATLEPVRMFNVLPLRLNLLTDPLLLRVRRAFVVLDHPQRAEEFEWAVRQPRVAVYDCPRWWSLYENRHPRLIVVPDTGETLWVSDLLSRVGYSWHGPFEAPPTLAAVGSGLFPVKNPVDPEWFARIGRGT